MSIVSKIINNIEDARKSNNFYKYAFAKILLFFKISHLITIKKNNYKIKFFPTSISFTIFMSDESIFRYSKFDEIIIDALLRKDDTFLDVGANIGILSIIAKKRIGKSGKVIAFEPHPEICKYASENFKLNNLKINLFNYAISNVAGNSVLTDSISDDMNYISSDIQDKGIKIKTLTLDEIYSNLNLNKIRLLKIDVEGFEYAIFLGANILIKNTDLIYFELWSDKINRYGYKKKEIVNLISNKNFSLYVIENFQIIPFDQNKNYNDVNDLLAISNDIIKDNKFVINLNNILKNKSQK